MRRVATEAVIDGRGVEERIDVEELRAGTDVQIAAVRREIGLGFVGPNGIESLAHDVFFDRVPVPLRRVWIGCVDVRTGFVEG